MRSSILLPVLVLLASCSQPVDSSDVETTPTLETTSPRGGGGSCPTTPDVDVTMTHDPGTYSWTEPREDADQCEYIVEALYGPPTPSVHTHFTMAPVSMPTTALECTSTVFSGALEYWSNGQYMPITTLTNAHGWWSNGTCHVGISRAVSAGSLYSRMRGRAWTTSKVGTTYLPMTATIQFD